MPLAGMTAEQTSLASAGLCEMISGLQSWLQRVENDLSEQEQWVAKYDARLRELRGERDTLKARLDAAAALLAALDPQAQISPAGLGNPMRSTTGFESAESFVSRKVA